MIECKNIKSIKNTNNTKNINHINNIVTVVVLGVVFVSLTMASWLLPPQEFSDNERRKLAQRPKFSLDTMSDGSFMTEFEKYTLDQFPLRDQFRTLKAYTTYDVFGQLDNHDIYIQDGYAAKLEYPLQMDSLEHAADRFAYIYEKYLADKEMNIYLSIVPHKSYFLAEGMGTSISGAYTEYALDVPFYGVYYGQSALPLPPETLYYLSNNVLDGCIMTNHEDQTMGSIYNMEKKSGKDPYEIFLSGPRSLITIDNPNCESDKELVIFRDSFGSSIAPLLSEGYAKITLVDIRYLRADLLERFIEFKNQDVLFLYSTSVLNHSETLT